MLRGLAWIARLVATVVLTAVMLVVHLPTLAGRRAVRDVARWVVPLAVPGHLRVGSVDMLTLDEIRVSDVGWADDHGTPMVDGASVRVTSAWQLVPAAMGLGPYPSIAAHVTRVHGRVPYLRPTPGTPSQGTASVAVTVSLPALTLDVDDLVSELPEFHAHATRVHIQGGVSVGATGTSVDLRSVDVTVVAMGLAPERLTGTLRFAPGPRADGILSLRGDALQCDLAATTDPGGTVRALVNDCMLAPHALDQLAARPPSGSLGLTVGFDQITASGTPATGFDVQAALLLNNQPTEIHARLTPTEQTADLTFHHVLLRNVVADLPAGELDGSLAVSRRVVGNTQHFHLDTAHLVAAVAGVPVPPVRASATLTGQTLTLVSLDSPEVGLRAHGTYDLVRGIEDFNAVATADIPDLDTVRWVGGRAHGSFRLRMHVHGWDATVGGDLETAVQNFRWHSLTLAEGRVTGRARYGHGVPALDLSVYLRRFASGHTVGPLDADLHVDGNPLGRMGVDVDAHGDGILAALPSPPAGGSTPTGNPLTTGVTRLTTRLGLEVGARAVTLDFQPSDISLRGSRGRLSGVLHIPRGPGLPEGHLRLATSQSGMIDATLDGPHIGLRLDGFDLAWLAPVVPRSELAGLADGRLDLDTRAPSQARAHLSVQEARIDPVGRFNAALDVLPAEGPLAVRFAVNSVRGVPGYGRGASVAGEVHVRVPAHLGDAQGWLHGVQHGAVDLTGIDLRAFSDLALPSGLEADGTVVAHAGLSRTDIDAPLHVALGVEGRRLSVGSVFGPVAYPMRVRAVACVDLQRVDELSVPLGVRVAVKADGREGEQPPPDTCDVHVQLLRQPLVTADARLGGPWLDALGHAVDSLRATGGTTDWPAPLRAELQRATVDAHATASVVRREWPLRPRVPMGFTPDEGVRFLPQPDVSMDTRMTVDARVSGSLLGPSVDLEADYTSDDLRQAGLLQPFESHVTVRAAPTQGDLLGVMRMAINGVALVSPAAPPDQRGQVALDVILQGDGSDLLNQGLAAAHVVRFDVDTQHIALERFDWAHQRSLRGLLDVSVAAQGEQNVSATVTVANLQARVGDALTGHDTPPIQAVVHTAARGDGTGDWTVKTCVLASLAGVSADCDPLRPALATSSGALTASATVPLTGGLLHLSPALDQAVGLFSAREFRLDALSPFVQGESIASIGGALSAGLIWTGAHPRQLTGEASLTEGRVEAIQLGEPLRNLDVRILAHGATLVIDHVDTLLGRGRLHATGTVTVGQDPTADALATVDLTTHTDDFPVEQEGNTYGWVTGDVHAGVDIRTDGIHATVEIPQASVLVQEQSTRTLQSLAPDPDVYVYGHSELNPSIGGRDVPIEVAWQIDTPIWLRRSDFAVAIQGHGTVRLDSTGTAMDGSIESASTQSWFGIFGKRFALDRIGINFDGNVGMNPELDIAAHLDSPSVGRLTITVTGRLKAPEIAFGSERYPDASQSEVLAMIVLGRRDTQGASNQGDLASSVSNAAGSLVAGLTLGLVTSALQQQVSFLPTIIADPGEANGGRYGAGISLSPRLYVQATYGAAAAPLGSTDSSAATQSEVRVFGEYAISPSISMSATYGTALNRWGADLFWSP